MVRRNSTDENILQWFVFNKISLRVLGKGKSATSLDGYYHITCDLCKINAIIQLNISEAAEFQKKLVELNCTFSQLLKTVSANNWKVYFYTLRVAWWNAQNLSAMKFLWYSFLFQLVIVHPTRICSGDNATVSFSSVSVCLRFHELRCCLYFQCRLFKGNLALSFCFERKPKMSRQALLWPQMETDVLWVEATVWTFFYLTLVELACKFYICLLACTLFLRKVIANSDILHAKFCELSMQHGKVSQKFRATPKNFTKLPYKL